jgi:outer membrane protein OmpA-like peptidoglycan-associated protein
VKRHWGFLFAALLVAPAVHAQKPGTVAIGRYDMPEHGSEWLVGDSLDMRGKLRPSFGIVMDGAYRVIVINKNDKLDTSLIRDAVTMHAGGSLVLWDRFRVGLDLPITIFQDTGKQPVTFGGDTYLAPAQQALGDLRLGGDVRIFGTYGSRTPGRVDQSFLLAAGLQVHFPTGSQADYTSDGTVRFAPRVLAAAELGPLALAGRLSFMLNRNETWILGSKWGQEFGFALSAGVKLLDRKLVIGPELWMTTVIASNPSGPRPTVSDDGAQHPVEALLGAHYTYGSARFGGGIGTALSHDLGAPQFRWLLTAAYVPAIARDSDGDGIRDDVDQCPELPGVAFSKKNGCPPDKDDDGVYDDSDKCPDVRGVAENHGCPGDQDGDGVPDDSDRCPAIFGVKANAGCPPDTDKDGVWDDNDACLTVPGPKKNQGCPFDADRDGIPDEADACPDQRGVPSRKPEFNGCPADVDGDGMDNDADACPKEKGVRTTDPATNGCPAAMLPQLPTLTFRSGSSKLEDLAAGALDQILDAIQKHPEVKKIAIDGHADGTEPHGPELSTARAAAVEKWLVSKGVAKDRLESKGFGSTKPLDRNTSEESRVHNRRVELHTTP